MVAKLQHEQTVSEGENSLRRNFELLFREHFTVLCYFARKYTGDLDSAKEIVHSVFIRIWENRSGFDWQKPAKSYLFTSVYNRSMNYVRDNRKFISHEDTNVQLMADDSVYHDHLEEAELESRIKKALQHLPEKCREIFELSRFENKKYAEIAEHLGISVKTVETQMSRALRILKEELRDLLTLLLVVLIKNMQQW